jgi:KEOPS complex subunit Cgi121
MRIVDGWVEIDDVDSFLEELDTIADDHGSVVQAFDARYLAGEAHLRTAVERANRAFDRDDTIADDRAIEILCYAAGRRQIERAMELGVKAGRCPVAAVIDGGAEDTAAVDLHQRIDSEAVLEAARDDDLIMDFFNITEAERSATDAVLEALVIERVSMLAIDK